MKNVAIMLLLCAGITHADVYEVTYQSRVTGDKHNLTVEAEGMAEAIKKGRTSSYGTQTEMEPLEVRKIRKWYAVTVDDKTYDPVDGTIPLRALLLTVFNQNGRFDSISIEAVAEPTK